MALLCSWKMRLPPCSGSVKSRDQSEIFHDGLRVDSSMQFDLRTPWSRVKDNGVLRGSTRSTKSTNRSEYIFGAGFNMLVESVSELCWEERNHKVPKLPGRTCCHWWTYYSLTRQSKPQVEFRLNPEREAACHPLCVLIHPEHICPRVSWFPPMGTLFVACDEHACKPKSCPLFFTITWGSCQHGKCRSI